VLAFAHHLGSMVLGMLRSTGETCFLLVEILKTCLTRPLRWRQFLRQMYFVGIRSQTIILVTGGFSGAVFTAQILFRFREMGMATATGPVVAVAMCRELGPVLCSLMLAGRVGSAIAAELSTMRLTEQLDALRALAVPPVEYLLIPRFLAVFVSTPLLVGLSMAIGIAASWVVAVPIMDVDGAYYIGHMTQYMEPKDVGIGLIKACFFGLIIAIVGIHKGLNAGHGAEGVGQATTNAAVHASLIVLISNFFFSFLLNAIFPS